MASPFPPHFFLRHVLFSDSMTRFGRSAVNAAAVASKFAAAAKVNEEFDGVVEVEKKVGDFKAKVE